MSIVGKMIIDGESFNLISYRNRFFQQKDIAGRPRGRVNGGLIEVKIEAHRDHIFHHWAVQPEQMRDLEIHFSPVTKVSSSRTIQLYDVYCARLATHFDNYTSSPMTYTLLLSPGIYVDGGVVFKKPWHVTDIDNMNGEEETDPGMKLKPQLLRIYYTDKKGNEIPEGRIAIGQEVFLIVETSDAKEQTIILDLDNNKKDFEFNGKPLKDDILEVLIKTDIQKIPLKVIAQQNN